MRYTKAYLKVKRSCKGCGGKRDGEEDLFCAECRKVYNREAQRRHREKVKRVKGEHYNGS